MKTIALYVLLASALLAQPRPEFEVASIRAVKDDGHHNSDSDRSFLNIHNLSLKRLVASAYGIDPSEVLGGPPWADGDGFDIRAKIPQDAVEQRRTLVPLMLQSLLAERFHLVVSNQRREVSGFALVVAKKGTRMSAARFGQDGSHMASHNTHLVAGNVNMEDFAKTLSRNRDIGMLVVDRTGLIGKFDFELDWKPEAFDGKPEASNDDRASIFTSLQEQLGLRLEATKISIEAIVIENAEKPGDN